MTDIPQMPNNASNYYRKALNELSNNNYTLAIDYLEKSYELEADLEAFEELVKIFIHKNMNEKLKKLWILSGYSLEAIAKSTSLIILYAESLKQFEFSEEALLKLYQIRDKTTSSKAIETINTAIQTIDQSIILMKKIKHTNNSNYNYINDLLAMTPLTLLTHLKAIYKLPLSDTKNILLTLLADDELINYIKSDIIHYLIYQGYNNQVKIQWFHQERTIDIALLKPYNQSEFYINGIKYIQMIKEKENPHLIDELIQLFTLHTMVCFPFLKESLINAENWLAALDDTNLSSSAHYHQLANQELDALFY